MRKAAEDAMLSHEPLYERAEVRKNKAEEICDPDELIQAIKAIDKLLGRVLSVGATIDQKRRLMLAIDKENVMTVSAALRSIPKTPEKAVNPILAALSEDDEQHD